ncbi:hypothetical protein IFM89_006998 [Coptis chinensis]|uniref:Uncharacterized protein n=1 Tax=Coptis chinensis TaxID=261450 RepID=A0A835IPQ2_9MAGN|nr:hypothetical protein IFM89_006998 [Coptis chinensis]
MSHPDFVEESFLMSMKKSLSEGGLFVINLVLRSTAIRETVVSRIKTVFNDLYCLQLKENVNEVLFALPMALSVNEASSPNATLQLQKLLKLTHAERGQTILDSIKKIDCLK